MLSALTRNPRLRIPFFTFSHPMDLPTPYCHGMAELPSASSERAKVRSTLLDPTLPLPTSDPLFTHLAHGLALTTGSALGSTPPTRATCLAAFLIPNIAGLTAGARAWSKHSHRSQPPDMGEDEKGRRKASEGWWGTPTGPVAVINDKALALFHKVVDGATWRNLHWLPHRVLVYEVRVPEGYGMRWSQDRSGVEDGEGVEVKVVEEEEERPWTFRGFVEPMMENGHEIGWRH
ncbi:hypothetical protein Hypma_016234 [Hypsizygus marmoreus]|uniref:Uncharacterized protein n=1 Tax=Hypsizygus marmoreus TaxID=39966 RepID=A0A369J2E8_HYPMA|nr:hypothetical protein Hypma_016234 [Hypsizygus marmoreus]